LMLLVQRVKEVIAANIKSAPIIIFTEEKLEWLVAFVADMQKQAGVTCCELLDAKQAMLFRDQIRGKTTGLLIASKEYARGLDLKFGSDSALVLVILTKGQLNYTEYTQMMGRSSRKQGTGRGMVFADQKLLGQADSIESYLKSLEVNVIKEGGVNLRQMFPIIPFMKEAQINLAKQHFDNDQWVTGQESFEYNRKSDLEKMKRASAGDGGN
jgi:superfamily II DNA/RNA helicase